MPLPPLRLVVLDTETTGFVPKVHRVVELAWVLVEDGKVVKTWESLLSITDPIPPPVEVLTRIRTADLSGKPIFADVQKELEDALTPDTLIVGQNVGFDIDMIRGEGLDLRERPRLDTSMLASIVFPEARSFSLSYLSRTLGLPHEPVHRALGDVHATLALLEKCWDRLCALPEEQMAPARDLLGRSSEGWKRIAGVLPNAKEGPRPDWLKLERGAPVAATGDLGDITPPAVGTVAIREQTVSGTVGELLATPLAKGETRRIVAVKNLESTLRRVVLPKGSAALVPPAFLLDPSAAERLLKQPTLTPDEATVAVKLAWYQPANRSQLPLHGDERAVWNGVLACTPQAEPYLAQFATLPDHVVIDHQQLLQFLAGDSAEGKLLNEGSHVVVTDASMLEDTATKAYGHELKIDDLRAAAQGHAALTSLTDLLSIWTEALGGEDVRYLTGPDIGSREAKGLREQIEALLADTSLPPRTRQMLASLGAIIASDALDGRIAWLERRRGGSNLLHTVPADPASLLQANLYARVPTTLLMPPGATGDEAAIVPVKTTVTRAEAGPDSAPLAVSFPADQLTDVLGNPPPGKTVVLLGSKRSIEMAFVRYTEELEGKDVTIICQGMAGGQGRMEADFLASEGTTLWLLTPWTYEGTELPPGSLDRLIVESLPFDHPSHPVLSRRSARMSDGFGQYVLPRLEQRLFRLLRTFASQRRGGGEVQVLDRRLFSKDYGKRVRAYLARIATVVDNEKTPTIAAAPKEKKPKPPKPPKDTGQLSLL